MGHKRRKQKQDSAEEACEEQGVLYTLVYCLHGGDVGGVRLRRQAKICRDCVGVEDAGYEACAKCGTG